MDKRITIGTKLIAGLLVFICLWSCHRNISKPKETRTLPRSAYSIVDENINPKPPVHELMRLTDLPAGKTLDEVIETTQSQWLRPTGAERAHLSEKNNSNHDDMMAQLDRLGVRAEVTAVNKTFDYVIIFGAMYSTFKIRLEYLEQLVKQGLQFKKLVLLGSHRPLEILNEQDQIRKNHVLARFTLTEIEMMDALLELSAIKTLHPNLDIIRISSPMKQRPDGSITRATTEDTVIDLANLRLKPGSVLAISSQPYIMRQELILRTHLWSQWQIETVGPKAPTLPTDVFLDELARILFEIRKFLALKN